MQENTVNIKYTLLSFLEQHKFTKLVVKYPFILEANPSSYDEELINEIIEFMTSEQAGLFPNTIKKWNQVRIKFLDYQLSGAESDKLLFLANFRALAYRMTATQKDNFNEKVMFAIIVLNYFTKEGKFNDIVAQFMAEYKIKDTHVIKSAMTFMIAYLQQTNPDLLPQFFDAATHLKYNNEPVKRD